jgi:hypothetical protein
MGDGRGDGSKGGPPADDEGELRLSERPGAPVIFADHWLVLDCGETIRIPVVANIPTGDGAGEPEHRVVAWIVMPRTGYRQSQAAANRLFEGEEDEAQRVPAAAGKTH